MMGILPRPAKQSVMFSLTSGDCQRGGAGVQRVSKIKWMRVHHWGELPSLHRQEKQ